MSKVVDLLIAGKFKRLELSLQTSHSTIAKKIYRSITSLSFPKCDLQVEKSNGSAGTHGLYR